MATDDGATSKVVVQTYLPEYQRNEWDAHADELDMSRSEFVKTMVQAGRRGFDGASQPEPDSGVTEPDDEDTAPQDAGNWAAQSFREVVLDTLSDDDYRSWDELRAAVTDDIESRLEETLQTLQAENRVRYSGRHGGYTLDP